MENFVRRFVVFLKNLWPRRKPTIYRILFRHSDFRQLPEEHQLFFIRLAHIADDLRHVFYLCVAAERGTQSRFSEERRLALHQLLFGVRLIYSILYEGWNVIQSGWYAEVNGQVLGRTWASRLSDEARQGLDLLGRYFGQTSLADTIRNKFAFHYDADQLREPLANARWETDEIMAGRQSGNVFYPFAEEIRALALLQAAIPDQPGTLWSSTTTEADIQEAAKRLYKGYQRVHNAFETFANDVLIKTLKSLPHKTEEFTPPRVTELSEMSPVLFVKEPSLDQAREMRARRSP